MSVVRELVTLLTFKTNGLRQAEAAFQSLQAKAQRVGDIQFRATGVQQVEAAIARLRGMARGAGNIPARPTVGALGGGLPAMGPVRIGGIGEARSALDGLRAMAQGTAAAVASIGAAFTVSNLLKAGDEQTRQMNQLRAELEGTAESAQRVYESIYGISKQTGVGMDAGVQSFTRMNNAVKDMGGTSDQVLKVIEGMQKAGAVAGTSSHDIAEVLRQMGQAFGLGRFQGDELRVLGERMGPLQREIANALGVKAGQLKELGSKGMLTNQKMWPALLKAVESYTEKFGRLEVTLERAKGVSSVVFTRFLADLDHAIDLTPTLARGLLRVSEWADGLRSKLPVVRQFVRDLGGIRSVLETVAIAAGLATAAFFRFGLSLIVPAAVVLGITAVAVAIQDLYYWVQGRPSLLGDFFGDFGPVRERIVAAVDFVAGKFRELRDEVSRGLGFASADDLFADIRRQFVEFGETSRREWGALKAFFASDDTSSVVGGAFRGMAESARDMWAIVQPILRGLVGGPAEMAKEWGNIKAAIGDPLKAIGGFFDDIAARAGNVATRIYELGQKLREFMAGFGLLNLTPGNGLPPDAVIRQRERDARGTEQFGPPAPDAPARPRLPGFGDFMRERNGAAGATLSPSSYMQELPGRMGRAQTVAASYAPSVQNQITINATGVSGAEVATAAQSGVGRAMDRSLGETGGFARNLGLDMSRTELAAV